MSESFYLLMSWIMINRIFFHTGDRCKSSKFIITKGGIEVFLLLLPFKFSLALILLVFLIASVNAANFYFEKKKNPELYRFLSLIVYIVLLSIFFPEKFPLIEPRAWVLSVKGILEQHTILIIALKASNWKKFLIIFMGSLMVTYEASQIVKLTLSRLKISPPDTAQKRNQNGSQTNQNMEKIEEKRGRIIGILERLLIYFFIIHNQLAAIGFILAAKSFARFKELDNRNFAEYVLIGTLLSASLALLIGEIVKMLITL